MAFDFNNISNDDYKKIGDVVTHISKNFPKVKDKITASENINTFIETVYTKDYNTFKKTFGTTAFEGWVDYYVEKEDYEECAKMVKPKRKSKSPSK